MAEALLITKQDLVKFTALNGNLDPDKFIQFIKIAQDIHIQRILGTKLLNKIKTDISGDDLVDPYLSLLTNYIKPMLIHWAMVEYLPYAAYTVSNGGVYKHSSENSETVVKEEVDFLVEKERNTAESYTQRFLDQICYRQSEFPEYNQNSNGDVYPDSDNFTTGWVL